MKKLLLLFFLCFPFLGFAQQNPLYCLRGKQFFPYTVTTQAMGIQGISQGSWDPIIQELENRSAKIPEQMQRRSLQVTPNPLQPPYNYEWAKEVWLQMLEQTFSDVMHEFRYLNPNRPLNQSMIKEMFAFIKQNYLDLTFNHCFPIPPPETKDDEKELIEYTDIDSKVGSQQRESSRS